MRKILKTTTAMLVSGAALLASLPADAGPTTITPKDSVSLTQQVDQVHYRRYRRAYYGYRRGYDPAGAAFAGIALGLLGAGVAAATAPSYSYGYPYGGYGYGYPAYYGYGYPSYYAYPSYYGGWGW